jgi:hypothetical protein
VKMKSDLEEFFEEFFPPRRSLIGLQFANEQDYERAKMVIPWSFERYQEEYPVWKMIVVRRKDAARFAEAGLQWQEIEQIDPEELPPEERRRQQRAMIDSWKKVLIEQGRWGR